ncbi:flagellar protein FlaG [Chthonobacter albigriseus]|uniref:flagellar protein FlaG n=1 Tax=Chthonobacter albigriseus TaxID=1683161 RepID=UPI0015EE535B|nr:flagellar protein FlaG [Chthonobacter albigriseus]
MEIGSIRPVVTGSIAPTPRAPAPQDTAVRTDLAGPSAVTDAQEGQSVEDKTPYAGEQRAETTETAKASREKKLSASGSEVKRKVELDPQTEALVFKKLDVQTGDVVEQVPEEAILRMRASIAAWGTGIQQGRTAAYDLEA